jgi:amino acid adenylation domain-containing protein
MSQHGPDVPDAIGYTTGNSLIDMFDASARAHPDSPCIIDGDRSLSYREVRDLAAALGARLAAAGLRRGERVGLLLERSAQIPVAILAALGVGAAYVPLDPAYPDERLRYIAEDAGIRVVLGVREDADRLGVKDLIVVDPGGQDGAGPGRAEAGGRPGPDDPAYVIYTSGSTGQPKGCVVTQGNVVALLQAALPLFEVGPRDRWSLFHSASFDFSVWELWGALATGAAAVVVPGHVARMSLDFLDFLSEQRITVLNQVPSVFRSLATVYAEEADEAAAGRAAAGADGTRARLMLRYLVFGGESVDLPTVGAFLDRLEDPPVAVNMYGITEITVHATFKVLEKQDLAGPARSPIGRALPHLALELRDEDGRPVGEGGTGELWISGAAVAAGYLNRPELTAQRFVTEHAADGPRRYYRTGDLARRLPGDEFEYLGRNDQQVKLRGFRIEPGEIEAVLRAYPRVLDAAVTIVTTPAGAQFLTACVVQADGARPDEADALAAELRAYARLNLPGHMVPDRFHTVDALPLTVSGKLDRSALAQLARPRRRPAG